MWTLSLSLGLQQGFGNPVKSYKSCSPISRAKSVPWQLGVLSHYNGGETHWRSEGQLWQAETFCCRNRTESRSQRPGPPPTPRARHRPPNFGRWSRSCRAHSCWCLKLCRFLVRGPWIRWAPGSPVSSKWMNQTLLFFFIHFSWSILFHPSTFSLSLEVWLSCKQDS
jgi:hypothetical protein